MRIEPDQHSEDRRFNELVIVGLVNVVGAHALENSTEQAELPVRIPDRRPCAPTIENQSGLHRDERQGRACRRTEKAERRPAHHLQTSLPVTTRRMESTVIPRLRKIKDVEMQKMASPLAGRVAFLRVARPSHPSMDKHDLFWIS
jgi:hypothetical protein